MPTPLQQRLETGFVALVFAVMVVGAVAYVATYGSRVLVMDDLSVVDLHWHGSDGILRRLWNLHNEHRIPLPRVLIWTAEGLTRDIRAASYVIVALLAATAFLGVSAARVLRGRTSAADALFPLLWLHTGNCENLLMGFQISLVLPTLLVCVVTTLTIVHGRDLGPRRALACAAALVGLPLCGGPGMLQAPVLALWLALLAVGAWRLGTVTARRTARVLAAGVIVTAVVGALYFVDFHAPPGHERTTDVAAVVGVALRVLALDVGQAAEPWWPWSIVVVASFAALALVAALRAWRVDGTPAVADTSRRWRAAALVAAIATSLALAVGLGFGRGHQGVGAGFAYRYVGLASPLVASAFLGLVAFAPRAWATLATHGLAATLVVARLVHDVPVGAEYGERRHASTEAFVDVVRSGPPLRRVIDAAHGFIDVESLRLSIYLQRMCLLRMHPFEVYPEAARPSAEYPMFAPVPRRVEGPVPSAPRAVGEILSLVVPGDGSLTFDVPPGSRRVRGVFGALDRAWQTRRFVSARFEVLVEDESGARTVAFARSLRANTVEADRGPLTFAFDLDPATARSVVLHVVSEDPDPAVRAWLWTRDLEFE